ncbi:MAG TPA: class I SAM-dependent methyltransferase [Solirubrobacterales bacterium]|jgi:ubiquinone/menaquinone biosynthesis C-methylase UbiE
MARDFYASPFGVAFSTYMERPRLARLISRASFGADTKPYYDSMGAIAEVPDGGTIVDCPCGAGPAFRGLRPEAAVRYVAADLSPSMIRRARKQASRRGLTSVEVIEADATAIPEQAGSADLFLSYWGLHCFNDPVGALAEAARILKPGGRLVGTCFLRGKESLRQRLMIRPHTRDFGPVGTEEEVLEWMKAAGFDSPSTQRSGPMLLFDARGRAGQGQTAP